MCSIPGLPTPGSEVSVLITRVNLNPKSGLVELSVNMGDEKKHIYEQMREEIQTPKRKFIGAEGKSGDLCLVCISDTWHRARIVSIQDEKYNVFLIDQGQHHNTKSEALAWGQSDSFLLPPEIESCILSNVLSLENSWPEKATKFLKSWQGKPFKGLVQHVLMTDRIIFLDLPISRHLCKLGVAMKVPTDEFKPLALERLQSLKEAAAETPLKTQEQNLDVGHKLEKNPQYFHPELSTKTDGTVIVTEVTSPNSIFCSLQILSKEVKKLSDETHQHYETSSDHKEAQPQICGDPCAAKGENGRWHRSLLKQNMTSDGTVEVMHVDEGKTELVSVGNIRPLHGKFLRMPVFTYHCSLDGVKNDRPEWTTEQINYLKSLLLNKTVRASFNHHDKLLDVYYVILYTSENECINSCFIKQTGLPPPLNGPPAPVGTFVQFLGDERCVDLSTVNINSIGMPEKALTGTKPIDVDKSDSVDTSGTDVDTKESSELSDPAVLSNNHFPAGFHFVMQDAHDLDDVYNAGRHVSGNVSCIESLQRFWCQTTENGETLQVFMQALQNHYASNNPQPFVESICVARNPDNGMWYRARILASHYSPTVDVRFIDYGDTRTVPLRDVRPIDPAFLNLRAQAFQCCLFNHKNPSNPAVVSGTDAELAEFKKFVVSGASSDTGLTCVVKTVTSDEEGLPLNVVDIETSTNSACKLLTQKCAQTESQVPAQPQIQSDGYNHSTYNIKVGGREEVLVTSSETVSHFYCQLKRNSSLFYKVMENVKQLTGKPQCKDIQIGLSSICFARYTDNQWYRGQVVEMAPKLKVHFVDYGETLTVKESDVRPFPNEASFARSAPVMAVPLGLHDIPPEVPQEVNEWFAQMAIYCSLTISVVAKGPKGKLIVELFDGSVNVNKMVKEKISKRTQKTFSNVCTQQTDQPLSRRPDHSNVPSEDFSAGELMNVPALQKLTKDKVQGNTGMHLRDEPKYSPQPTTSVSATDVEHEFNFVERTKSTLEVIIEAKESVLSETFIQGDRSDSTTKLSPASSSEGNVNICRYKRPDITLNKTEEVYASCIVGPDYFWCQSNNTEDLSVVSRLAQEAGNMQLDVMFSKTVEPGSPCLALFPSDNQWYRAQVIQRTESTLNVMFIDYGNESEVDIMNVRAVPQSLLDQAPQAFLCTLNGFDDSKGSWDDRVYDDFYTLLVDKPLKVMVLDVKDHSETKIPQHAVQIVCGNVLVNEAMQKLWKTSATEYVETENPQIENSTLDDPAEFKSSHLCVSKENANICMYKKPNISTNKQEEVYASCIVEPHYFWCQYANTEELDRICSLVQEAGKAQQDNMFPETLTPGSPCLALFSSDKQWYRAQVMSRADDTVHVLFIDYGNEADLNLKDVRLLPQRLLDPAPQAFLCSLNGFDVSRGSWDDRVSEDFYNVLVDKPLKLKVFNLEDHSEHPVPQYAVEIESEGVVINTAMQKYWRPVAKERVSVKSPSTETLPQDCQTESNTTHSSFSKRNVNICMYKKPKVAESKTEMVYASCIAEPHYFWCQSVNTEELNKLSVLAQEAGREQQNLVSPEPLGPGSPCLALYSSDGQWYRAQVISKTDDAFHVVFIDYGNEAEIPISNVRPLPQSLLDQAPQAFLCSLNGFDKAQGSWDEDAYDDFYNLLVEKTLGMTMLSMDDHSDNPVPQYKVDIECNGVVVNTLMQKYWKGLKTDNAVAKGFRTAELDGGEG